MNKAVAKVMLGFENTIGEESLMYMHSTVAWGNVTQDGLDTGIGEMARRCLSAVHSSLIGHIATIEPLKGIIQMQYLFRSVAVDQLSRLAFVYAQFSHIAKYVSFYHTAEQQHQHVSAYGVPRFDINDRSEERRVGKEGRYRWAP